MIRAGGMNHGHKMVAAFLLTHHDTIDKFTILLVEKQIRATV
jgi:hypothetical protein